MAEESKKERFTDEEKCLMQISKTDPNDNLIFADEDMMRNIGIPYFQKMMNDYMKKEGLYDPDADPVDFKYENLYNPDSSMRSFVLELAKDNGDWERLTEKLTADEQVIMCVATDYFGDYAHPDREGPRPGQAYFNNSLTNTTRQHFEDCAADYDSYILWEDMLKDVQKIMSGDHLPYSFSDEGELPEEWKDDVDPEPSDDTPRMKEQQKDDKDYIDAKDLENAFNSDNYLEGLSPEDLKFEDDSDKISLDESHVSYDNRTDDIRQTDFPDDVWPEEWDPSKKNKMNTLNEADKSDSDKNWRNQALEENLRVLDDMKTEREKHMNPVPDSWGNGSGGSGTASAAAFNDDELDF